MCSVSPARPIISSIWSNVIYPMVTCRVEERQETQIFVHQSYKANLVIETKAPSGKEYHMTQKRH